MSSEPMLVMGREPMTGNTVPGQPLRVIGAVTRILRAWKQSQMDEHHLSTINRNGELIPAAEAEAWEILRVLGRDGWYPNAASDLDA